jgi:hypothetical protein
LDWFEIIFLTFMRSKSNWNGKIPIYIKIAFL